MIKRAFIQAGGEGTRLRPVTLEIPKPLIPVQGLPILTWQTRWFMRHGIERITVIVPKKWAKAFQDWSLGMDKVDVWVEQEPMGTLGAFVHHLADEFGSEPAFVSNGDELKGLDLTALAAFHEQHKPVASIGLISVPNPSDYGVAEMDGHRIGRFHEKPKDPPSNLINSGLYVIDPAAFASADASKKFLMFEKDLFPQLAEQGRLGGCALSGPWYDCGTLERWEKAINEWREPGLDRS